jgi:hypothetical protein
MWSISAPIEHYRPVDFPDEIEIGSRTIKLHILYRQSLPAAVFATVQHCITIGGLVVSLHAICPKPGTNNRCQLIYLHHAARRLHNYNGAYHAHKTDFDIHVGIYRSLVGKFQKQHVPIATT